MTASPLLPQGPGGSLEVLVNADVEPDADTDGYGDETQDNCPNLANPTQADLDDDHIGDACDADDDADGLADVVDNCPRAANADQADVDRDGIGDACDAINRSPTVSFQAPVSGTAIGPSVRIVLDVTDDTGSPTVSVFDDDGPVCVVGCSGSVTVRIKQARKTVPLSKRCAYSATLRVRIGKPRVSFGGNPVLAPT